MIKREIVAPLLDWYDQNKRILPWRENKEPYRIWVSEIMLQQTRVEAVKPYFDRFITELPGVKELAGVEEDRLMKLWEGLGYYNRAKNMQKAARIIMEQYGGELPALYEQLLQLPGIGSYTAGAVASIAFNKSVAAVDGNVLRILTRLMADSSDILNAGFKKQIERQLLDVIPGERAGDFNQAMMELGAMVCVPGKEPHCEDCPWMSMCRARAEGKIQELPYKAPKKTRTIEKKTVLIIRNGEHTLIRRRPKKGLLAGLYEFPTFDGWLAENQIKEKVLQFGYQAIYIEPTEEAVHVFSHKEWHMKGYLIKVEDEEFASEGQNVSQCDEEHYLILSKDIQELYPIPSAFKAFTKYSNVELGNESFLR